jgi:plastocyanin
MRHDVTGEQIFNAALGPNFCLNVALAALGQAVTLSDLFSQAAAGSPNAGWDFAPDTITITRGTNLSVVNEGGEPHTFTEVKQFGGGFIPGSTMDGTSCLNARMVSQTRKLPPPASSRAASAKSLGYRMEPICSNAAAIPGCARK